jgi:hypothetical protein
MPTLGEYSKMFQVGKCPYEKKTKQKKTALKKIGYQKNLKRKNLKRKKEERRTRRNSYFVKILSVSYGEFQGRKTALPPWSVFICFGNRHI